MDREDNWPASQQQQQLVPVFCYGATLPRDATDSCFLATQNVTCPFLRLLLSSDTLWTAISRSLHNGRR